MSDEIGVDLAKGESRTAIWAVEGGKYYPIGELDSSSTIKITPKSLKDDPTWMQADKFYKLLTEPITIQFENCSLEAMELLSAFFTTNKNKTRYVNIEKARKMMRR